MHRKEGHVNTEADDWNDAATSQETPRTIRSTRSKEEAGKDFSLETPEGA